MSPAVNDLSSDTLSPTKDNGVLGKLTNPVVNLLPVQQETVCKLASVLNKISVLQAASPVFTMLSLSRWKFFSWEALHNPFSWQRLFSSQSVPYLKTFPTFLLGKPLGVVEKDYSFVSFFNNIFARCWGPQLREPRVWFYNYNHAAKVMVTIWAILVGFANHYFLAFSNSIYILLNNWNTYGQTGAELFCRMLGSWVYPWYLGRVKSCSGR